MKDKYTAVWISYSSGSDYLKCPRLYYLRNVYRDPETQHKMALMQPSLALGQTVHDTIDEISKLPFDSRLSTPLPDIFEKRWKGVHGELGGFMSDEEEKSYFDKGFSMMRMLMKYPGPLVEKAIKIRQELPHFFLSEEENIILCGKIDWLEYLSSSDSVHIIDFKTGKYDEDPDSLQLPIYYLLVKHCQTRRINKASYWYLDRDNEPVSVTLPDETTAYERVLELAKKVVLARKLEHFKCKNKDGCKFCTPYESIIQGKAEKVGINDFGQDIYILPRTARRIGDDTQSSTHPTDEPF